MLTIHPSCGEDTIKTVAILILARNCIIRLHHNQTPSML